MNPFISHADYKKQIDLQWKECMHNSLELRNNKYIQVNTDKKLIQKNYCDINLAFYCLPSFQYNAWSICLDSVRQHYPDNKIVLMEDGHDHSYNYKELANKYNCIYVDKEVDIYLYFPTYSSTYEFLLRTLEAVNICQTEWLMLLHPDNLCYDKICRPPLGACNGLSCGSTNEKSNNMFRQCVIDYLHQRHPQLNINGFGWAGGSVIHCQTFKKIMEFVTIDILKDIKERFPEITQHEDIFMPFLFNYFGYEYRVWIELEEANRGFNYQQGAFTHGIKHGHVNEKASVKLVDQGGWMFDILMKKIPIAIKNDEAILINPWEPFGQNIIDQIKKTGVKIVRI